MSKARIVGVGIDFSATSKLALKWAAENLIAAGDLLILITVHPSKSDHTMKELYEDTGSPLIPLEELREMNCSKLYGIPNDPELIHIVDDASRTKRVKVMAKVYWGDPREKLCSAVADLSLDSLVVGSRGLGPIKSVLMGSVSKRVVSHASCPVTVVKETPSSKHGFQSVLQM